jgi:hypothetical protein
MSIFRSLLCAPAITAFLLGGCGTYVPEIQEFPGGTAASQELVHAIVRSIHCDIRNAITYEIDQDKWLASLHNGARTAPWIDKWGVQVALTLTIDEKGTVSPSAVWTPPNPATALFMLGGGINASSDAQRIDTFNYYYTVKDLYALGYCPPDDNAHAPLGSLLIQGDLRTRELLETQIFNLGTGEGVIDTKTNGFTHQVQFEVDTSGTLGPAWQFVHVTVNQPPGSLLSADRKRTHNLLMTFGPVDPTTKQLAKTAAGTFLAAQIGIAVNSNNTRTRLGF